jgi:TolB-like protein
MNSTNTELSSDAAAGQPAPAEGPRKKKGKVRSAWIGFVGRITAQMLGSAATVGLGLYFVDHSVRHAAAASAAPASVVRANPPADRLSVAVLPLQNLSGDPDQEYLADTMTDAIIAGLARARGLRVVSRTSSMAYKTQPRTVSTAASELGVGLVVEGSLVHVGNRLRVTVQLVEAAADQLVWSETHDASFTDALGIRDVAAKQIADDILSAIGSLRTPGSAAR